MKFNRREMIASLMKSLTFGAAMTYEEWFAFARQLGSHPLSGSFNKSRDAFHLLSQYNRFLRDQRLLSSLANLPQPGTAMANNTAGDDELCVITIKVMNLIHTPLLFKFADYTGTNQELVSKQDWATKIDNPKTLELLKAKGLDKLAENARFKALNLNHWFASILETGKDELGGTSDLLDGAEQGAFPADSEVALQAFLHLNQNNTSLNHSFQNTAMLKGNYEGQGGDLTHHLDFHQLVDSPLGICCLTSNDRIETTDGFNSKNRVVGSDLKQLVSLGKTIEEYFSLFEWGLSSGKVQKELVNRLDQIVDPTNSIRNPIHAAREQLVANMALFKGAVDMQSAKHMMQAANADNAMTAEEAAIAYANVRAQAAVAAENIAQGPVESEYSFLAQCAFASRALDIPGKPLRNFCLVNHVADIDNKKLDQLVFAPGKPLSNIEGMRQLAMGLNLLAQSIKRHKNVLVVVISEGGRGANGGDNKISNGFLMGPASGKYALKDFLYADKNAISNGMDSFVADPNIGNVRATNSPGLDNSGSGLRFYTDPVLKSNAGTAIHENKFGNTAALLNGVVKHIEDAQGAEPSLSGMGNYFKIQKKS